MKTNEKSKTGYLLVAQQRGDVLTIGMSIRDELKQQTLRAIRTIGLRRQNPDERALAASAEWERLAELMAASAWRAEAVQAYREALLSCLDGDYYDHGKEHYPSRLLRIRYIGLFEKATAYAACDSRLQEVISGDSFIREEYERFSPTL